MFVRFNNITATRVYLMKVFDKYLTCCVKRNIIIQSTGSIDCDSKIIAIKYSNNN